MPPKRNKRPGYMIDTSFGMDSSAKRARTSRQEFRSMVELRVQLPFSEDECLTWFNTYAEDNPSTEEPAIGPPGIERLCADLQVSAEDLVMLGLAWKLQAAEMGYFSRREWIMGMRKLDCDSCEKLKNQIPKIRDHFNSVDHFKSIYQYSFDLAKSRNQRNLDIVLGKALLKMLLEGRWCLLDQFIAFLHTSKYQVFNRDQWYNILEFSKTISPDLHNYDMDGAWPVMLDEFVEYCKNRSIEARADE